jgi:hypothetical protein
LWCSRSQVADAKGESRLFQCRTGGSHEGERQLAAASLVARVRISMLHKAPQFAPIALAILVFAFSVSACLVPAADTSIEQRECCRKMAGRCETSVMPSSHSCCQHPGSHRAVIVSKIQRNDFGPSAAMLMQAASPLRQVITRSGATSFESPPESPPQIINVLRI